MEEEKQEINEEKIQTKKMKFFKRLWYSISKIEKYPDMAAEGFKRALGYLVKIVMLLTLVISAGMIYQTNTLVQKGINYLNNEFPEFTYKDGMLSVASETELKINQEKFPIGEVIVDTNTEDEQKVNQYINELTENGEGVVVLKDKLIIKNSSVVGTINYSYKDTFEQMGITEFNKQDVIDYTNGLGMIKLYASLFLTIFVYSFIMYFLTTISNVVLLSIFGFITTLIAKIRMRYVAIFNMSVYAITLSVILNMIYIGVNVFVPFSMEYFQVMYVAVAAIYLVAAILILKSDFIKKQAELMKIAEAEEIIKKENEEEKREEPDNKEKDSDKDKKDDEKNEEKEKKKKSKDKKEKNTDKDENKDVGNLKDEPEGSNA